MLLDGKQCVQVKAYGKDDGGFEGRYLSGMPPISIKLIRTGRQNRSLCDGHDHIPYFILYIIHRRTYQMRYELTRIC